MSGSERLAASGAERLASSGAERLASSGAERLTIVRTPEGVWVGWPGRAKFFGPERNEAAVAAGHDEIRAPMTGKVVKVKAVVGLVVAKGDVLVILEAMKMEYRIASPQDGVVEAVLCREGEQVDLGKALVDLKSA